MSFPAWAEPWMRFKDFLLDATAGKFKEGLEGDIGLVCTEVGAKRVLKDRKVGIPLRPPPLLVPLEVEGLAFPLVAEMVDILLASSLSRCVCEHGNSERTLLTVAMKPSQIASYGPI